MPNQSTMTSHSQKRRRQSLRCWRKGVSWLFCIINYFFVKDSILFLPLPNHIYFFKYKKKKRRKIWHFVTFNIYTTANTVVHVIQRSAIDSQPNWDNHWKRYCQSMPTNSSTRSCACCAISLLLCYRRCQHWWRARKARCSKTKYCCPWRHSTQQTVADVTNVVQRQENWC